MIGITIARDFLRTLCSCAPGGASCELVSDDALATIAQFQDEIVRADAPVGPRSREFAEVLRAMLLVLKSHDGAPVRAALAVAPQDRRRPTQSLSPRERSILHSMSHGLSNKTHRSRAADRPRDRKVPRQKHFHQARRADARPRRIDGSGLGLL